jgi:hypothetical protein
VFDTEQKKPGWDQHEVDYFWLVEVRLANESETTITVEEIRGKVRTGGNKWLRNILPFVRKTIPAKHVADLTKFIIMPHGDQVGYEPVPSLLAKIANVPLVKGVGYRGWLCFSLRASQKDMLFDGPLLDVWLVDALYGEHRLIYKKDEKTWDSSFVISRDI